MSDKKKYIITSITLGAIAASSGLLIGVTNLVTKDQITKNEENKINNGIKEIFDQNKILNPDIKLGASSKFTLTHFRDSSLPKIML